MDVSCRADGRLEGTIRSAEADELAFSGTLELLKALEDALKPTYACTTAERGVR
jgi:hypothetical protein